MISEIAIIVGISVAAIASLMNMSAPIDIWLIANQIQLLSLLLLTDAFLPLSVKSIFVGSQFTSFSLPAIPVTDMPVISTSIELLDIEQENVNLELMGVNSASAFVSNITLLLSVVIIIMIHILTLPIPN